MQIELYRSEAVPALDGDPDHLIVGPFSTARIIYNLLEGYPEGSDDPIHVGHLNEEGLWVVGEHVYTDVQFLP